MKVKHRRGSDSITLVFFERTEQRKVDKICSLTNKTLRYLLRKKPKKAMIQITRGFSERTRRRQRKNNVEVLPYYSSTKLTPPQFQFRYRNFLAWLCEEIQIDREEMEEKYGEGSDDTQLEKDMNLRSIKIFFYY